MHTAMNEVVIVWVVALSAASVLTKAWSAPWKSPFDAPWLARPGRSVRGSGGGPESGGPPPALWFEVAGIPQAAIARLATSAASRRGFVLFMVIAPCRGSFMTLPPRLVDRSRSPSGRLPDSD